MRKCQACQRSTFDSAKFCHHCGAKMGAETLGCPQCNHENIAAAKFCENCGFDLLVPTPPPTQPPKRRSIFDDIEEENTTEELEEKVDLIFPKPAVEETAIEEATVEEPIKDENSEKEEEEEFDLNLAKTPLEAEPEKAAEIEAAHNSNDNEPAAETLDFIFEKTPKEVETAKFDIPFEIVENLPAPEYFDTEIAETSENQVETSREIIEEDISEAAIFEEIIKEKEQQAEDVFIAEEEIVAEEIEEFDLNAPSSVNDLFEENPNHNVEEEIFKKFAATFEKQIKTEQNPAKYNTYVDRFDESDFKISFEFRIKQLAEEIQKMRQDQSILKNETTLLNQAFTELIDYFLIRYCEDLNQVHLSEKILQYQNIAPEKIDLSALILDYLDFDQEDERVDFDFIKMPIKRLQNASKNYLFPTKGEKIFFICDQSILSSGKEGFAMTEKAIYWKMPFESAQRVYYKKLQNIERQKDWININEMFFNANPSLNVKLMKLLKKIKRIMIDN